LAFPGTRPTSDAPAGRQHYTHARVIKTAYPGHIPPDTELFNSDYTSPSGMYYGIFVTYPPANPTQLASDYEF